MSISTQLLNALQSFMVYFVELSILFLTLNMLVGYLNARFSAAIQKHLHTKGVSSYLKAMFLGAITPFCSCSTIPFFLALLRNKIPLGVSFAYLMTSPLINPIIIAMLIISFGLGLTSAYIGFVLLAVSAVSVGVCRLDSTSLLRAEFDSPKGSCCGDSAQKNRKINPNLPLKARVVGNKAPSRHRVAVKIHPKPSQISKAAAKILKKCKIASPKNPIGKQAFQTTKRFCLILSLVWRLGRLSTILSRKEA